ncbi:DUF1707 and DUF2154 domain-containing protein [Naumannella sp. ID2617S]|nr:DUF1707 and DUF2154 domain-containing protein [Naumannella sp. ID2617S]
MSPAEPDDVGPAVGGDLRASDADRTQVLDLLSAAYAEGRLTREEHEERSGLAHQARTFDDLVPLTRDLVPLHSPLPQHRLNSANPSNQQSPNLPAVRPEAGAPDSETLVGILGGSTRKGIWHVRRQTRAYALMGGNELDFTDAVFDAKEVVIEGFWMMGGLEITVPAGVNVRDEVVGIMGGTEVKGLQPDPDGPTIVIKGVALMGGVEVKGPDTFGGRRRAARRQRREQRRIERGH